MENASKALVIAGGILLAMIILSLLVFVFGSMNNWAETQDTRKLSQQIAQFNNGFEAYNKQRMYGADIITVVNKAIENNNTVAPKTEDPWYVNIGMTVKQTFETKATEVNNSTKEERSVGSSELLNLIERYKEDFKGVKVSPIKLTEDSSCDLGVWEKDNVLKMNNGIISFLTQEGSNTVRTHSNCTYYIRSALTDFKSAIFTCSGVEYDDETGRIKEMTFEQIQTN